MNIQELHPDLQKQLLAIVSDYLDDRIYGFDAYRDLTDPETTKAHIKDLQLTYSLYCTLKGVQNG